MDTTHFDYTISSRLHEASPFTAKLTGGVMVERKIHLQNKNFLHQIGFSLRTDFIPLYNVTTVGNSLNCDGISQIMTRLGGHGCSRTILREIKEAITLATLEGKDVTQVKILKIKTRVYNLDVDSEKLLIDKYCDDSPETKSLPVLGCKYNNSKETTGCVICMEDYRDGSIIVKLPCDHDFHGVCIDKWLQIKHSCPLCRLHISNSSSSFSFFFWIFV